MKFLDDISIEQTSSTPAAPANNNFGTLYASASAIYYRNSSANFKIGYPTTSGVNVIYYTGSNNSNISTYTWSKPPGCKFVRVFAIGPGGGGGSGACQSAVANRTGGGGGGGGAMLWAQFLASDLPSSVTVTVPGCFPGGAATSVVGTGLPGSKASASFTAFGNFVSASGGDGGFGGLAVGANTTGVNGGLVSLCRPRHPWAFGGNPGGGVAFAGNGGSANFAGGGTIGIFLPARGTSGAQNGQSGGGGGGGGAGGGIASNNVVGTAGSGSGGFEYGTTVKPGSTPGTANTSPNGQTGLDNYIAGYLQIATGSITVPYGLGQGGAGGAWPSGSGGNGGFYGAGGGGGGAGPTRSGAGGSGSAGLCVVIEYL